MPIQRINPDGSITAIPLDLRNADYRAHLVQSGKTHQQCLTEQEAEVAAERAAAATETDRRTRLIRSARAKFLTMGITRAEFRALFPVPDPD